MLASELRKRYLDYFSNRGHKVFPSSSLVPKDPTLLFTSAGMVQFKEIFWGKVPPRFPAATTCQKCFRTTDIENVGKTAFHHTFFEMLGNFSFGDYFKEGAIDLAWKFVTGELSIPRDRLWVSVYEEDNEAYEIWRDTIGIPPEKIVRLGKEHNWWGPVGNSGPCGPDSEIFYDAGQAKACGPDCRGVACSCDRFSEIWNLVFMQYDAQEDGGFVPLRRKNIDTGMGLERTSAVLQGVASDFEIDLFRPIVEAIQTEMTRSLRPTDLTDRNVVADHIRGTVFLIADGVLPGNEKQGYVLRRILRRAIRAGEKLGLSEGALRGFVEPVVDSLGAVYPEIVASRPLAERVVAREEATFRRTLASGERRLKGILKDLAKSKEKVLPGEIAFELYDTYGFPLEMTEEIAAESGVSVDRPGFEAAMAGQRKRSRVVWGQVSIEARTAMSATGSVSRPTDFLGYEKTEAEGTIAGIPEKGDHGPAVVVDSTPFYAESGGQIADIGTIENLTRAGKGQVVDVQKNPHGAFLHRIQVVEGDFQIGDHVCLSVDVERRKRIARNHTATHLLHAALRQIVGKHVIQAGSYVSDEELRFDFSHFEALTPEEIRRVEDLANQLILADLPVTPEEKPLEEAIASGAMAHFEEEYKGKEKVRVVSVGDKSRELCGGTHVRSSGEIGLVKVISEESVAAGTRRIRAVTGEGVLARLRAEEDLLGRLKGELGEDPLAGLAKLRSELDLVRGELLRVTEEALLRTRDELLERAEKAGEATLLSGRLDRSAEDLKRLADLLEEGARPAVVLLAGKAGERGVTVSKVSKGLKAVDAGALVRTMASLLGGGGGGNRSFAQGGGPKVEEVDAALAAGVDAARAALIG
jgi:alanyl-tRNA synthetase